MLNEIRSEPSQPPRVVRNGHHVVVQGPSDPLREDFASSGTDVERLEEKVAAE